MSQVSSELHAQQLAEAIILQITLNIQFNCNKKEYNKNNPLSPDNILS
jgi:hypothetical protein